MVIDFGQNLLTLEGKNLVELNGGELSLLSLVSTALKMPHPNDQGVNLAEKEKRYALLLRINGDPRVELSLEDLSLLRTLVARLSVDLLAVGQALRLLGGEETGIVAEEEELLETDEEASEAIKEEVEKPEAPELSDKAPEDAEAPEEKVDGQEPAPE